MELTKEEKVAIVNQKIKQYQGQIYNNKLDLACADALEDEQWKERIREATQRIMKLVDVLEQKLDAISD